MSEAQTCSKCGEEKKRVEFSKHRKLKDKLQYWCKACVRTYDAGRYKKNPEKYQAKASDWGKNNPENRRVITARWRKNNPENDRDWYKTVSRKELVFVVG